MRQEEPVREEHCGIDLYGVNANKKYLNGAHAAKAHRRRKSQAADSELYQGLRHAVCSGAKAQPFHIAANICPHEGQVWSALMLAGFHVPSNF